MRPRRNYLMIKILLNFASHFHGGIQCVLSKLAEMSYILIWFWYQEFLLLFLSTFLVRIINRVQFFFKANKSIWISRHGRDNTVAPVNLFLNAQPFCFLKTSSWNRQRCFNATKDYGKVIFLTKGILAKYYYLPAY